MSRRHKAPFRPCQTRDSFKERLVTLGMDAQYVSWQPAAAFAVRRDHFDLYLIDLSRQLTADLINRPLMLRQARNQSINQPIKHPNKQSNAYAVKVTVLQMPHPSGTPSSFFNFLYVHIEFDRSISASMHKQALHSVFREKLIDRIAERLRPEHASERHYDQSIKEVIKRYYGSSIPRSADEEYQRVKSSQPQPRVTAADLIALSLECAHTVEPLFKLPSIYHSINQFTLEIIEPDVECMIHQEDDLDLFLRNMNDYIKVAMKTLVVVDSLGTNTQTVLLTIRDLKLVITLRFEQPYAEPDRKMIDFLRQQLGLVVARARKMQLESFTEHFDLLDRIRKLSCISKHRDRIKVSGRHPTFLLMPGVKNHLVVTDRVN